MSTSQSKHAQSTEFDAQSDSVDEGFEAVPPVAAAEDPYITSLKREIAERDARLTEMDEKVRYYAQSVDKVRTEYQASRERMQRENERNAAREKASGTKMASPPVGRAAPRPR